jgi:hypothetical protein
MLNGHWMQLTVANGQDRPEAWRRRLPSDKVEQEFPQSDYNCGELAAGMLTQQ